MYFWTLEFICEDGANKGKWTDFSSVLRFCASSPPGGFWAHIPHGRQVVPTTTRSPCRRCVAAPRGRRPRWRTAHRDAGLRSPRERRPNLCSSHPASLAHLTEMETLLMPVFIANTLHHRHQLLSCDRVETCSCFSADHHTPTWTYHRGTGNTVCSPPPSLHTCLLPFQRHWLWWRKWRRLTPPASCRDGRCCRRQRSAAESCEDQRKTVLRLTRAYRHEGKDNAAAKWSAYEL